MENSISRKDFLQSQLNFGNEIVIKNQEFINGYMSFYMEFFLMLIHLKESLLKISSVFPEMEDNNIKGKLMTYHLEATKDFGEVLQKLPELSMKVENISNYIVEMKTKIQKILDEYNTLWNSDNM